jgi:parvulin-like peptidyl-prolyl isomerase
VTPEQRDLLMLIAKDRAHAERALRALRSGQDFTAVASKFSVDPTTRNSGGRREGYTPGRIGDPALDAAISKARVGALTGPVKDRRGQLWLFKVTRVTPERTPTDAEARAEIRKRLLAERRQKVLAGFMARLQAKWKPRTTCKRGFMTSDCRGGPRA